MEKVRITGNNLYSEVPLVVGILFALFFAGESLFAKESMRGAEFFIAAVIFFILYYFVAQRPQMEFDANFLYIESKTSQEKIPLEMVTKVTMTAANVNNLPLWKIQYQKDGSVKNIRFVPKGIFFSSVIGKFQKAVKEKNPNVNLGGFIRFEI